MSGDKWLTQKKQKETIFLLRDLIYTCANSDGLIKCLPQPGTASQSILKSMSLNSVPFNKSCGTRTVSSPGTTSLALSADALVPCFLPGTETISSWPETHNPYPDLVLLHNFTATRNFVPSTRTGKKLVTATTPKCGRLRRQLIKPPGRFGQ